MVLKLKQSDQTKAETLPKSKAKNRKKKKGKLLQEEEVRVKNMMLNTRMND